MHKGTNVRWASLSACNKRHKLKVNLDLNTKMIDATKFWNEQHEKNMIIRNI